MADRRVSKTVRDDHGNITALASPGAPWSPRRIANVIADIDSGEHTYYVYWAGVGRSDLGVAGESSARSLNTTRDTAHSQALDAL